MPDPHTLEHTIAYAVHMIQAGLATVDEAANAYGIPAHTLRERLNSRPAPPTVSSRDLMGSSIAPTADLDKPASGAKASATDHFVFYQVRRWRWERISETGEVTSSSQGEYSSYLDCVADARRNGWEGTPSRFVAKSDRLLP